MKDSQPNGYELSHIPAAPAVASKEYLLSEILDRLAALEEREREKDARLAALEEENRQLKEEVREASQGEQTARFCAQQLHTRIMDLEEEYRALREEAATLKGDLRTLGVWTAPQKVDDLWEWVEDLDKTRTQTRTSTASATYHVDRLFKVMTDSKIRQISATNAARLLGITARHVRRLKPQLAADKRFQIVHDPQHKQRHLIRLARP